MLCSCNMVAVCHISCYIMQASRLSRHVAGSRGGHTHLCNCYTSQPFVLQAIRAPGTTTGTASCASRCASQLDQAFAFLQLVCEFAVQAKSASLCSSWSWLPSNLGGHVHRQQHCSAVTFPAPGVHVHTMLIGNICIHSLSGRMSG